MKEIFKDIKGYEGLYKISNLGIVKSMNYRNTGKENILKPFIMQGYGQVDLKGKKFYIHRLVLLTFKGYSNLQVNHKDGDKTNNRLKNLEYCTNKENMKHSFDILGNKNITFNSKRGVIQKDLEGCIIKTWESIRKASNRLSIHHSNIGRCCKGIQNTAGGFIWSYV